MRFLQSKDSLFRALEKANSFIVSKFLALFRQNSIFFPFCAEFPAPAVQSRSRVRALCCHVSHATTTLGYHIFSRLSSGKVQEPEKQDSGFGPAGREGLRGARWWFFPES
jgi:hypothetical protein